MASEFFELIIILFSNISVITLCCFIKLRVPRTKSEIAANARRKDLLSNFRSKITTLKAGDLDDMDYRRGKYFVRGHSITTWTR